MATGNRKTTESAPSRERMERYVRQIEIGDAAAIAYLKFLRDNDRYGTLEAIAFDMFGEPRSASLRMQAAAFFGTIEKILRQTASLLNIRRADDHDQICGEFVRAFNLTEPRRGAYLKDLPQTLIKKKEAAAKKAAAGAEAEAPKAVQS